MILSGLEIQKRLGKDIIIEPFSEEQLNPNSYNIGLHRVMAVYKNRCLDAKISNEIKNLEIPDEGLWIMPGRLYLGRTKEYTETHNLVPMLEGRCHGKGTKILMANKKYKNVEDIVVGDVVMGADSKPSPVTSVHSGVAPLYSVRQSCGMEYTTTGNHLLSLYCNYSVNNRFQKDKYYNVTVDEYISLAKYVKDHVKGYRIPVEFGDENITVNPYYLGVWLGDGNARDSSLSLGSGDWEIVEYLKTIYPVVNTIVYDNTPTALEVTFSKKGGIPDNPMISQMREYGIIDNKHIPEEYMKSSLKTRKALFAGLIDSDGSYPQKSRFIEFDTTIPALRDGFVRLCHSLGYSINLKERKSTGSKCFGNPEVVYGPAWRFYVTGDFSDVPFQNKAKQGTWNTGKRQQQRHFYSKLDIQPIGDGEYFGFELGANKEYFLEDNTVTHNSSIGRLGIYVHVTAGFGDVGFCGYWTLEISCVQPVKIYPDLEICQIYYHTLCGKHKRYSSGKYQNAKDIQPSLLYTELNK